MREIACGVDFYWLLVYKPDVALVVPDSQAPQPVNNTRSAFLLALLVNRAMPARIGQRTTALVLECSFFGVANCRKVVEPVKANVVCGREWSTIALPLAIERPKKIPAELPPDPRGMFDAVSGTRIKTRCCHLADPSN